MTLSFPLTLTDRFALIMRGLSEAVAARIRCFPVTATIIVHICARLRRITVEFETLAGEIRAGTYVARAGGDRRARGAGSRPGRESVRSLHYRLGLPPFRAAWLHRVAPGNAGVWAEALRHLLSDPEMAAVLSAVPRMGRILRPLCFMLGVEIRLPRPTTPEPSPGPRAAGTQADPPTIRPPAPVGVSHAAAWRGGAPPIETIRIPDMPGAQFFPA